MLEISVVIPTLNRREMLAGALSSVAAQGGAPPFEIVVVDNGSSDGTGALVEAMAADLPVPVRLVHEPRRGAYRARNTAVRHTRSPWLAFIDDDEIAGSGWLAGLADLAASRGADIVGGTVRLALPDGWTRPVSRIVRRSSLREMDESVYGRLPRRLDRGDLPPGCCNMLVGRRVFERLGGFDLALESGGADLDFVHEAWSAGMEVWVEPRAVVTHRIASARLAADRIRAAELASGRCLATLDRRHKGAVAALVRLKLRTAQLVLVTLPALAAAAAAGNRAEVEGRRSLCWRYLGYLRTVLARPPRVDRPGLD